MEQRLQWPHTKEITKFYKISLEKSQNKLWQVKQPWGEGRMWFPELPHYNIQNAQFSTKNFEARKEIGTYGLYVGKKNRNCPEEAQTSDLLDKDFKSGILRMFKELEETMYNELRKL